MTHRPAPTAPTAFTNAPGYAARHPVPTPPQVADAPPYLPENHVPPTPPMPTMKVTPRGMLYLHASLRQALGLQHGQPINLRPPEYDSVFWHLDLRPSAPRRVVWHANTPSVRAEGIRLPPGLITSPLTLYLMPGAPLYDGYYPLLPENAFTAHP